MKGLSKYPAKRTGLTDHPFYLAVLTNEVYDASPNLTNEQKDMAMFWRDVPGPTTPAHWLSILQQVINKTHDG